MIFVELQGQEFEAKKKKSNSTVFLEMEQSLPEEKRFVTKNIMILVD